MKVEHIVKQKMSALLPHLTERQRRLAVAAEARFLGYGGVSLVSKVTGITRKTIHRGFRELNAKVDLLPERSRQRGGGRKKIQDKNPSILKALQAMVDSSCRGDPMSPLR